MFDKCPRQYEHAYIDRLPRGSSPALERGLAIHKKAENYVNGIIKSLPDELKNFKKEFNELRKIYKRKEGFTEPDVSLNSLWKLSNKDDTDYLIAFIDFVFFDPSGESAIVIDYKTGKKYPGHRDQAHVYAMAALCIEPNLKQVDVEFWYLDDASEENVQKWAWKRSDLDRMKTIWIKRIDKMHKCKEFEMKPTRLCGWCSYNKKKGGPCEH
jgi:hypothetical protein